MLTTIDKLTGKDFWQVTRRTIARLTKMPLLKTNTIDNEQVFRCHEGSAEILNLKTYFTRPFTSQDKGTVANISGVIRIFFPKKTDLNVISNPESNVWEKNSTIVQCEYLAASPQWKYFQDRKVLLHLRVERNKR